MEVEQVVHRPGDVPKDRDYYVSLKQGDPSFFKAREDFELTSSDFGAAVGVGRFKTPRSLYEAKTGPGSGSVEDGEGSWYEMRKEEALEHGRRSEPLAREHFSSFYDVEVRETGIHPIAHPFLKIATSPDGIVYHDGEAVGTYEAKCPMGGYPYRNYHLDHLVQVHAQIQGTGLKVGFLHCWTSSMGSVVWRVERDDAAWSILLTGIERFVQCMWLGIVPEEDREYIDTLSEALRRTVSFECRFP